MKATEALLKDHLMIRKILEGFHFDHPRFSDITKTLQRIVIAHAWFEDEIFLPALKADRTLERLNREISDEHKDIADLLTRLRHGNTVTNHEQQSYVLQLQAILTTHFEKEENALFPLAERILDSEGLNRLGEEMARRKTEVRNLL